MRLFLAFGLAAILASPATAGEAHMTKGNATLALSCDGSGCSATITQNGKTKTVDLGIGGYANFSKHQSRYRAQGWK